jgi:hypothetical protein
MMNRAAKFRQAAIVYLHLGLLYEGAAWVMWRRGLLPVREPAWLWAGWFWMLVGAGIVAFVVWGLWKWQNVWLPRVLWVVEAARVPTLIGGAFFPRVESRLGEHAAAFYLTALVAVMINLAFLARAGWDV